MAVTVEEQTHSSIKATVEDGVVVTLSGIHKKKRSYYHVTELNGEISIMNLFAHMRDICSSGLDNWILGNILDSADVNNEIHIHNVAKFADSMQVHRNKIGTLLKKAVDSGLLHKIDTGHYLISSYVFLSKGLTAAGYAAQEAAQMRWRKLTGLLTDKQLDALIKLGQYLSVSEGLRPTEFNISVAEQYASKGNITDKQKRKCVEIRKIAG